MNLNDTSGDLTLEDISTGDIFILRHDKPMYHCGRKRTNEILTSSILASREHCLFLRVGTQIHVIDKGAANGIYINGVAQQPNLMVTLKINDIIGLGSPFTVPQPNTGPTTPTIYVLKQSQANQPAPSQSANPSAASIPVSSRNEAQTRTTEHKRKLPNDTKDTSLPCKIAKLNENAVNNRVVAETSEPRSSRKSSVPSDKSEEPKVKSELPDIIDITDAFSSDDEISLAMSSNSHKSKSINEPVALPSENVATLKSNDITGPTLPTEAKETNDRREKSLTSDTNLKLQKTPESDKAGIEQNDRRTMAITAITTDQRSRVSLYNGTNVRESPKSNEQVAPTTNHSEDTSSGENDLSNRRKFWEKQTSIKVNNDRKEFEEFLVAPMSLDDLNLHQRMEMANTADRHATRRKVVRRDENGLVQWIKYEPEVTIVDDDEAVYANATSLPLEPSAPTPLKLKRVKQEAKTRYSEIDVVTLSDDDDDEENDDFFPASQLFGDATEEPANVSVKSNELEEHEPDIFADERNDDPRIVLLMDSDNDEDDPLYNRVMQSSLNESRDLYVKREPEEQSDNFVDEHREIYDLCFPDADKSDGTVSDATKPKNKRQRSRSTDRSETAVSSPPKELKEGNSNLDVFEDLLRLVNRESGASRKSSFSEKSFDKTATSETTELDRSDDKEREDTSSKTAKKRVSSEKQKKRESKVRVKVKSSDKTSEDSTTKESGHKAETKEYEKRHTSLRRVSCCDDKTTKLSDVSESKIDSDTTKVFEKSRKTSTDRSDLISVEKSRVAAADMPARKAKSIDKKKSASSSSEDSEPIVDSARRRLSDEKSRSLSKEKSRTTTDQDISWSKTESPVESSSRVDQTSKSVPIVEAPFLEKGSRRSTSGASRQIASINDHDASTASEEAVENAKKIALEPGRKLTAKEKKEQALKAKQEKYLQMKEQKLRRTRNKWAECLPPRTHQGSSLTRKEKEEIRNDRKEKLKKIADEKKRAAEMSETKEVKRPVMKPIAKITEKTRADYLVGDLVDRVGKTSTDKTALVNDARSNCVGEKLVQGGDDASLANDPVESSYAQIRSDESANLTSAIAVANGNISARSCDKSLESIKRKDKSLDVENVNPAGESRNQESHSYKPKEKLKIKPSSVKRVESEVIAAKLSTELAQRSAGKCLTNVTSELSRSRDPRIKVIDPPVKPLNERATKKNRASKVIKRVTFNDGLTKIQLFEIEPGNNMKKCPTTDAPIQAERTSRKRASDRTACPKLEQFLLRIFSWNPAWLQEQKQLEVPPPVVDTNTLIPMLSRYSKYEEYYKIAEPLLALELWYQISRDLDISDKKADRGPFMSSIVSNSICLTTVPSTNIRVTTLILEVVVSKRDLELQSCPTYGDLVFFEYMSNAKGKKCFCTVFAYVEKVRQTVITLFTHYNRDLLNYAKDPYAVLSYSVLTKPLDPTHIQTNRVYRLRKVSYLRSNMRMIQALQYLPASPLMEQILHPEIGDYQLPEMPTSKPHPLVTKDNLNAKQLEAVVRVTEAVVRKLPKVCLVQGPPGTGKSRVIVNLVTEILYGGDRYNKNKKMRILVCAPSNAAIDEIVLRLLEVRQSIPENTGRFKMVRIGRPETMHPVAKGISLNVLAKKDVKTTTQNYMSPTFTIDSVEEEKHLLTAKINSQQLELSAAQSRNAPDANYLAKTLSESRSRLDLLTNRQPLERIDPKVLAKLEKAAEATLLMGADVITCTLTSCYTGMMESIFGESGQEISVCIVDEATQCAEAECLIPLMLGVRTLILVGDTNQLPATIISQKAKEYGLDQSLFARIQNVLGGKETNPIIQLDTQYRMSWPVALWPNRFFYGGALKNAANLPNLPFHFYKVINLDSTQDNDKFSNTDEATFVANLFYTLMARTKFETVTSPVRIGIITPYNNQKALIKGKIRECINHLPEKIKARIVYEVNTVDSFQGQERDVIIMSCVRSSGIGFLSDRQRLCVALTRAKHTLILCGNFKTFERDPMWNALLTDAKSRGVYMRIKATATPDDIKPHIVR